MSLPKWPAGTTPPKGLYYIGSATSSTRQAPPDGTSLTDVYADGSHWDLPYQKTVYAEPKPQPDGCATFASDKFAGKVCLGPPPQGDFAPAGRVGLDCGRSYFCGAEPMTSDLEAPPVMDPGYLLVENVCPEDSGWPTAGQGAGRDIKVILPKNRVCQPNRGSDGRLQARLGGTIENPAKDIWVVGGQIENKWGQGPGDVDFGAAGLRFQYWSGTAFVEGAHIDMKCTCEDAINSANAAGSAARVVIQNSFLTGFVQCTPGSHGDTFHAQGGGQRHELKLQNVWSQMTFQGIMSDPRIKATPAGHGVSKLELDRFYQQRHPSCQSYGKQGYGWRVYWQNSQGDPPPEKGVWFNEAYFTSYNDAYFSFPAPTSWDATNCAVYAPEAGVRAGKACLGAPPNGPPVSLDKIGLNYDRKYFSGQP